MRTFLRNLLLLVSSVGVAYGQTTSTTPTQQANDFPVANGVGQGVIPSTGIKSGSTSAMPTACAINSLYVDETLAIIKPCIGGVFVMPGGVTITPTASIPVPSIAPGAFSGTQTVTFTDPTPNFTLYYTTDGTTPTINSAVYTTGIAISATTTIRTLVTAPGYLNSAVTPFVYVISLLTTSTPTFSPAAGTYSSTQSETPACTTPGCVVHSTTDGVTTPTCSSPSTYPLTISATTTVQSIACANGYLPSPVASAVITISLPVAAAPTFNPVQGTYTGTQSETPSSVTTNSVTHSTTDGSTPTCSSPSTYPLSIATTTTVKSIACAAGYQSSTVSTAVITISLPVASAPTFSPVAGTYTSSQNETPVTSTPGGVVHSTTDGVTTPTCASPSTYPLVIASTTTVQSITCAAGYQNSTVSSAVITINLPTAAAPTFNPVAGSYTGTQSVTPSSTTTNSVTHSTTDNSTPTCSSPSTYPLSLTTTTTVKSIACASGYQPSTVSTALFTISTSSAMSVMSTGVNPNFNGFTPLASTDTLHQDISSAALSFMNARYHALYDSLHIGPDTSVVINAVNSATQTGQWYSVLPTDSTNNIMVFLTGTERFEGQTIAATPFTCWSTLGTDTNDHHLFVYDIATQTLTEIYQEEMCDGVIYPYSAKTYDLRKALDLQNFFGGDSIAAGGDPMSTSTVTYENALNNTITYAQRFTVGNSSSLWYTNGDSHCPDVGNATHGSSDKCTGDALTTAITMPYGARLRLNASFDVSSYSTIAQNILNARKKYGMSMEDTGGIYSQYTSDSRWNQSDLAAIGSIAMSNYDLVASSGLNGTDTIISTDTNDDANGSDSVVSSFTQVATSNTAPFTDSNPAFTVTHNVITNPYNRPTINSFSVNNTTVALGQSVIFTISATNAVDCEIDNAGMMPALGSKTWAPIQTATYTPYCRGQYGVVKGGTPVTVTVTNTVAALPAASVAAGTYTTPQTTAFTTSTSNAVVHVVTDATSANCNSPVYAGPYSMQYSGTYTYSVVACGTNMVPSSVTHYTYVENIPITQGVVQTATNASYGSAITVAFTNTPSSSNQLFAMVGYGSDVSGDTVTVPSGWSLISHTANGPTSFLNLYTATSVGTGSYAISTAAGGSTGGRMSAVVFEVVGGQVGLPVDVINTASAAQSRPDGTTGTASFTTGAMTPTGTGELVIAAITAAYPSVATPQTPTLAAQTGWIMVPGAPGQIYENVIASYRQALTSDTTTPISNTFSFSTIDGRDDTPENAVTVSIKMTGGSSPTVATPTISPATESSSSPVTVSIADSTSGALIYYSTTGTATCSSTAYSAPFSVSSTSTVSAIACKTGSTNSGVTSATFTISGGSSSGTGATPTVASTVTNSGSPADGTTVSASYNFTTGQSALLLFNYTGSTAAPSAVACGGSAAVQIGHVAGSASAQFTVAAYLLQTAPTGTVTCTGTFGGSVFATLSVAAINATSGLDGTYASATTVTAYPKQDCGTFNTTVANDLVVNLGQVEYGGNPSASTGYMQIYSSNNSGAFYIAQPTAGAVTPTMQVSNSGTDQSCMSFALKPVPVSGGSGIAITMPDTVQTANVTRPGINISGLAPYGTQQTFKNLNYATGGDMPGTSFAASFLCSNGSQSTTNWYNNITDTSGYGANFWVGATYTAVNAATGTSYGSGTITASTANTGANGTTFTLSTPLSSACSYANNDVLIVKQANSPLTPQQAVGGALCANSTWNSDTSPSSTNTIHSLQMPNSCAADFTIDAVVQNNTNTTSNLATTYVPWINLNGTYTATFKAKCLVAGCTMSVVLVRGSGATYVPYTTVSPAYSATPGAAWTQYWCNSSGCGTSPVTFTAAETGNATDAIYYNFSTTAGTVLLQDADLIEGSTLAGNTTVFRDAVVYELQKMKPGSIRYMDDTQWCTTVVDGIAATGNRKWCAYNNYLPDISGPPIGYGDVLALANVLGTDAEISVGVLNQASDWTTLVNWLNTSGWINTFSTSGHKIYLEVGNEAWNTSGGQDTWAGNGIVYGYLLGQDVAAAKAASGYNANVIKIVGDAWDAHGQGDSIYGWTEITLDTAGCTLSVRTSCPDYMEIATYNFSYLNTFDSSGSNIATTGAPFADMFAEIANFNSVTTAPPNNNYYYANGSSYFDTQFALTHYNIPTMVYETNVGLTAGTTASQLQLNQVAGGVGEGLALAENMLLAQRDAGITGPQNVFQLAQNGFKYNYASNPSVPMWGATRLMATGPGQTAGALNVDRPTAMALEIINNAIGTNTNLMSLTQTGTPTTSYAGGQVNSGEITILPNSAVNSVNCIGYANSNNTHHTAICFNNNLTISQTVTFTGAGAPTGTVTQTLFPNSNNIITDNNENTYMGPSTVPVVVPYPTPTTAAAASSYVIPPASMIALTY